MKLKKKLHKNLYNILLFIIILGMFTTTSVIIIYDIPAKPPSKTTSRKIYYEYNIYHTYNCNQDTFEIFRDTISIDTVYYP